MTEHASAWIDRVRVAIADIEATMASKNIPVLRGSFRNDSSVAIIDVRELAAATLTVVTDSDSLCVLEYEEPPLPLTGDSDLSDLHLYLRIGRSDTWIHYCLSAPESRFDDRDDDESSWSFGQRTLSIDSKRVNELAVLVARAPGFSSLRNGKERQDFANSTCNVEAELTWHDVWEIAKMAESCFTLGVAPSLAKALEKEGKSVAQIGKELGLSKVRTERALATTTPAHILKLL